MSNRRTDISVHNKDGGHLQATSHETDSPILPVGQLRELQQFRPELVDWVIARTEEEAKSRRSRQTRVDLFVFIERIGGLVLGTAIAALGLGIAAYLALNNHDGAAIAIGGGTLVSLVGVIVSGKKAGQPQNPGQQSSSSGGKKKR